MISFTLSHMAAAWQVHDLKFYYISVFCPDLFDIQVSILPHILPLEIPAAATIPSLAKPEISIFSIYSYLTLISLP